MTNSGLLRSALDHGPSELRRIDYLDGWRGLAISLVLIHHFFYASHFNLGRMGVDVFFVLSGMLMAKILFVRQVDLSTFYKRRISRILPAFFVYVSLVYFFDWLLVLSEEHHNYVWTLLFLRTYLPAGSDIFESGAPIGHLWSLNVEEHAYILLSLLTLLPALKKWSAYMLMGIGMLAMLIRYVYLQYPEWVSEGWTFRTEVVMSHLFLSAGYFLWLQRHPLRVPGWLPLCTLALTFYCYSLMSPWFASWLFSPFLLAFTVNHLSDVPAFFKRFLELSWLRMLGVWSFSIYLWQQPFYHFGKGMIQDSFWAGLLLMLGAISVGLVSFYKLENPIRRYLNRRW